MNIDAIVIEIKENEISEDFFLLPQKDIKYTEIINKNIYILHPKEKELHYTYGAIKGINDYSYEITHSASSLNGSSGSPIFLEGSKTVIGIHKQDKTDKKENYGNFIYPIIKSLKENLIFEKKNYGKEEYEGELKNSLREGFGKCLYEDGRYYIGEWRNGLRNGKGIIYYNNNTIEYEGDFLNDQFSGSGKYIYKDGSYYNGEWDNNQTNNKGTIFYKDNTIKYQGDFRLDKFDGDGLYIEENGNYYRGEWKDNKKNGKGVYYIKETNVKKIGEFKDDICNNYQVLYEDDYYFEDY